MDFLCRAALWWGDGRATDSGDWVLWAAVLGNGIGYLARVLGLAG